MTPQPRLSDPDSSPRFPFKKEAKRERPIWEELQFGPWQCDVRITPITGLRRGYALLEISCAWQKGPALDESLGATPPGGMAAVDTYLIDKESPELRLSDSDALQLAQAVARTAVDLLRDGIKPDLPLIVREIRRRSS